MRNAPPAPRGPASWPALATSVAAHAVLLGVVLGGGAAPSGNGVAVVVLAALPAATAPDLAILAVHLPPDPAPAGEAPAVAPVAEDFPLSPPTARADDGQAVRAPGWLAAPPRPRLGPAAGSSPAAAPLAAPDAPAADLPPPHLPPEMDPAGCPAPAYPRRALRRGLEGTVWLRLEVGADGWTTRVDLERSSGHAALDEAALDAARAWRLHPARADGRPVAGALRVPVTFRIQPEA